MQVRPPAVRPFRSRPIPKDLSRADAPSAPCAAEITAIIPAFNEESGIATVIKELQQVARDEQMLLEILVVDDGSSDATAMIASRAGARVVQHRHRRGYGAALNTGMFEARGDMIVMTDADGTYPAQVLPLLVSALEDAEMAVALRPRFTCHDNILRSLVKIPLTWLANYITGTRIPDLNSGMRAFRRNVVLPYLGILPDGFSWTTTITLSLLCDKLRIAYCPAAYRKRLGHSKFGITHAAMFPLLLLRIGILFSPFRVFMPFAALSALYAVTEAVTGACGRRETNLTVVLAAMCSMLFVLLAAIADVNSTLIRNLSRAAPCRAPRRYVEGQLTIASQRAIRRAASE